MSTGKFTYDIVLPTDKDFPLAKMKINKVAEREALYGTIE